MPTINRGKQITEKISYNFRSLATHVGEHCTNKCFFHRISKCALNSVVIQLDVPQSIICHQKIQNCIKHTFNKTTTRVGINMICKKYRTVTKKNFKWREIHFLDVNKEGRSWIAINAEWLLSITNRISSWSLQQDHCRTSSLLHYRGHHQRSSSSFKWA